MNDLKQYSWLIILACSVASLLIGIWYSEKQLKQQKVNVTENEDGTHTIVIGGAIFTAKPIVSIKTARNF